MLDEILPVLSALISIQSVFLPFDLILEKGSRVTTPDCQHVTTMKHELPMLDSNQRPLSTCKRLYQLSL
jgi:hypothetical protein